MLTATIRPQVYEHIRSYCHNFPGVYLLGVGGTKDHIHIALEIEPTVVIDKMIGKIKGACARDTNKRHGMKLLQWQRGYGVVSFARLHLPGILKYIELQEQHHSQGTTRDKLEQCGTMESDVDNLSEDDDKTGLKAG